MGYLANRGSELCQGRQGGDVVGRSNVLLSEERCIYRSFLEL